MHAIDFSCSFRIKQKRKVYSLKRYNVEAYNRTLQKLNLFSIADNRKARISILW